MVGEDGFNRALAALKVDEGHTVIPRCRFLPL
jgi:hypothetical protein